VRITELKKAFRSPVSVRQLWQTVRTGA